MQVRPEKIDLDSIHLIEASAGTGKTYTITSLYMRLLVEKKLRPEQILVLTFTEAAVKELHARIRARLHLALQMFEGKQTEGDDFLAGFVDKLRNDHTAKTILVNAERSFDLASIYTIHGFCQRVLQECAFESGSLFELETTRDDNDAVRCLIDDFWRLQSDCWPDILNNYLQSPGRHALDADFLFKQIVQVIHPLRIHGPSVLLSPPAGPYKELEQDVTELAGLWQKKRQEILQLIDEASLSRARDAYRQENVEYWAVLLDRFFADRKNPMPVTALQQFSWSKLADSVIRAGAPPQHNFFDRVEDVLVRLAGYRQHIWNEALSYCLERLAVRKRQAGICTFDDLLISVRDGLRHGEAGAGLAAYLRKKYPVALVDEFQDTDSVQFEIFESIYQRGGAGSLFLVGDPKQAIYKFRGADIFTYMKAAEEVPHKHCLKDNYRSCPELVEAVNMLFGLHDNPFFFKSISYQPVKPAVKESRLVIEDPNKPLTIWYFDEQNVSKAKSVVARAVAGEVGRLICAGQSGGARLSERPLGAGDIAVLVRSHTDGEIIRQALLEQGIASVSTSRKSVYATVDAWELQLLLEAVENSGAPARLKAALTTTLMGRNMEDLLALESDEQAWDELQGRFRQYRLVWQKHGFVPMLHAVMRGEQIDERIAAYEDGERRLTNIRHLLELLQENIRQSISGPAELISWLRKKRHESGSNPQEEEELRLESDEHLVRVVTIHKSKGLEFPVVFCPFLWDSHFKTRSGRPFVFFHDNQERYRVDYQTALQQEHYQMQLHEEMAEELRLLYVALTRARERCYLTYGKVDGHSQPLAGSALAYLLHPSSEVDSFSLADRKAYFKKMSADAFQAPLTELAETGKLYVAPLPESSSLTADFKDTQIIGPARSTDRLLGADRTVRSFSSMQDYVAHGVEEPDHDGLARYDKSEEDYDALPGLLGFPRGKQAGSCLHGILEQLDFRDRDIIRMTDVVQTNLVRFGFSEEYTPALVRDIINLLEVELARGMKLADIASEKRLDELEFFYTMPGWSGERIKHIFLRHMGKETAALKRSAESYRAALGRNYMKGYIDLVFEWQGRFYIIDYKSNYLGGNRQDYRRDKLAAAMADAGYDLQYYIYTVALHRYLNSRLQDNYDYDDHFGGVYYLFLRGMSGSAAGCGIFHDRPGKAVIEGLDRELRM